MNVVLALAIGLASGYFSGQFGIGGGLITTPGIRLLLGEPAIIALGTPLAVIIPSAVAGAYTYSRSGHFKRNLVIRLGVWGVGGVVAGSYLTGYIDARLLMLLTALIIFFVGASFSRPARAAKVHVSEDHGSDIHLLRQSNAWWLLVVGFASGFYSGLLGMGGGLLLIPALIWIFGLSVKASFGTSLAIIAIYALPGSVVHYLLGHIDLTLAAILIVGVVPGAYLGARVAIGISEATLRQLFGLFMLAVAGYFAYFEVISR